MESTISGRLKQLLDGAGLTQVDLAAKMKISQSAVSQWLTGAKSPSAENLVRIATLLGVSYLWLEKGEGDPPIAVIQRDRDSYGELLEWGFRPEPADGARDYGNANLWSLPWDIETLVREAVQNVLDVLLDSRGAEVEFKITRLRGPALEEFLTALKWEGVSGLRAHLDASTDSRQKLSTVLRNGLKQMSKTKELLLLCVEDRGTEGLVGAEIGKGNFAALTRNNLDSTKQTGSAGGSYGLGKAVFWRASQFATVLFHSTLSTPVLIDGESREVGRFIGRVELPWHEVQEGKYAGPGWYGKPDPSGKRVVSMWNEPMLFRDLYLARGDNSTGTSIMVVGFNDPSSDKPKDIEELKDDIARAIARNFWPALESGKLTALVSTWEGRTPHSNVRVEAETYQKAFFDGLRAFREDEVSDRLAEERDVIARPIPLEVPKRVALPNKHGAYRHEATLIVRRDLDEELDDLSSHLAVYRGREMVIKYYSLKNVTQGAQPFRAILLCGEAAGSTDADRAAEIFLRTAEPPAHNDWASTPELKAEYDWGAKKRIDTFLDEAKRTIRELVRPSAPDLDDGPRELKELLKLTGPVEPRLFPKISRQEGKILMNENGDEVWSVQVTVRPPDSKAWRIQPALLFAAESGGGKPVPWNLEAIEKCTVLDDWICVPAGTREAIFRGESDPTGHPVAPAEASVAVTIRRAERSQGESK